jgi:hypothetical protein
MVEGNQIMSRIRLFLLAGVLSLAVACTTNEGDQITNSNYYYEQIDSTSYPRFLSPSNLDTVMQLAPLDFTIIFPTTPPIKWIQIVSENGGVRCGVRGTTKAWGPLSK